MRLTPKGGGVCSFCTCTSNNPLRSDSPPSAVFFSPAEIPRPARIKNGLKGAAQDQQDDCNSGESKDVVQGTDYFEIEENLESECLVSNHHTLAVDGRPKASGQLLAAVFGYLVPWYRTLTLGLHFEGVGGVEGSKLLCELRMLCVDLDLGAGELFSCMWTVLSPLGWVWVIIW